MRKIIDDNGKLFGAINIFDLVVLFMISITAFFAFKWVTIAEDPSWVKVDFQSTYCQAYFDTDIHVARLIREGDKMVGGGGITVGRIEKIQEIRKLPDHAMYNIILIVKVLTYKNRGEFYQYSTSNIVKIGSSLEVNTDKYVFTVRISKVFRHTNEDIVR